MVPQFEEVAALSQQLQQRTGDNRGQATECAPLQRYVLQLEALVPLTETVMKAAVEAEAGKYLPV